MRSRLDSFCYSSRLHAVCIHHGTWKHLHAYRDMRAQAFNSMVYGDLLSSSCSLLMTWRIYRVCFAQIPSLNISAAMGDGAKGERGNGRSGGRGGRRGNGAGGAGEASPRESPRESPRCAHARARVRVRLHAPVSLSPCVCLFVSECMRKSPCELVCLKHFVREICLPEFACAQDKRLAEEWRRSGGSCGSRRRRRA
jgi:hypothetical protein